MVLPMNQQEIGDSAGDGPIQRIADRTAEQSPVGQGQRPLLGAKGSKLPKHPKGKAQGQRKEKPALPTRSPSKKGKGGAPILCVDQSKEGRKVQPCAQRQAFPDQRLRDLIEDE